jgi:hypothetical protein
MKIKDILSIAGHSGLFRFISKSRQGIIVESFEDGKRMNVYTSMKVISLVDISVYTNEKDLPLADVLKKISEKENGGPAINHKSSNEEIKKYFEAAIPDYDKDRVYVSDMKKILNWYNILQKAGMLTFDEETEKEEEKA